MEFEPWQVTLVSTTIGSLVGFSSSFIIEWYKKRKPPRDADREAANQIVIAAKDNVATTQSVIELLEGRLDKERIYYDGLIDRSKKDCQNQISDMKQEYDDTIKDLQAQIIKGDGEKNLLSEKVYKLTEEKNQLSKQFDRLTEEKTTLQKEVLELKERLTKYEKKGTGPLPAVGDGMGE